MASISSFGWTIAEWIRLEQLAIWNQNHDTPNIHTPTHTHTHTQTHLTHTNQSTYTLSILIPIIAQRLAFVFIFALRFI